MSLAYLKQSYQKLLLQWDHKHGDNARDRKRTGHSIFSRLPNELIHHILSLSLASDLSGKTCLSLCLVASWTRELALPYLFSTIIVRDDPKILVMEGNHLEWSFHPEERKQMVRNLWCTGGKKSVSVILAFMRLCPGMANISINGDDFCEILFRMINCRVDDDSDDDTEFQGQTRESIFNAISCSPRELHFHPKSDSSRFNHIMARARQSRLRDWNSFAANFLSRVTTLFLPPVEYRFLGRFIQWFPCLTHLAVPYISANFNQLSDLRFALHLPSLQMLVLAIATDKYTTYALCFPDHWIRMAREHGSKVYLMPYETDINAVRIQWSIDARGGGSIWERAAQYTEDWEMVR
jgi:hypothetical protein